MSDGIQGCSIRSFDHLDPDACVVDGRTITSWPTLRTDLTNAGANWVDEEVHVDKGLVSRPKPDDLPAFCAKIVEEFAEGKHAGQASSVV